MDTVVDGSIRLGVPSCLFWVGALEGGFMGCKVLSKLPCPSVALLCLVGSSSEDTVCLIV